MAKTKKKNEDLKGMKAEDLMKELATLQDKLREIKFKAEGSRSKNVKEEGSIRKQIARVLTQLNTKENSKK